MTDTAPPGRPAGRARLTLRRAMFSIVALLLYALLVDAAVETYRSGADVRFWVALPVAAYVSFTVWLVRQHHASRPGPVATIWLSSFLFLALLAITASMPDGVRDGMRVGTLPTSTVLSLTTIAVIALALVSLTVGSPLPIAGRIVAALAACYGLAAFGTGIAWHRTYIELLQGASFWQRLPYFLQGAFVGALVVLPLAFALEVGVALARVKVRGRRHRIVAFALGMAMAYAAFTAPPAPAPPGQTPAAAAAAQPRSK